MDKTIFGIYTLQLFYFQKVFLGIFRCLLSAGSSRFFSERFLYVDAREKNLQNLYEAPLFLGCTAICPHQSIRDGSAGARDGRTEQAAFQGNQHVLLLCAVFRRTCFL